MAELGFAEFGQRGWAVGMVQSVARHRIPENGAFDIRDGLLDDDGNVYQRGATTRITAGQLGTKMWSVWEGAFSVGRRTIGLSDTNFGVLNVAGTAWVPLVAITPGATRVMAGVPAQVGEVMFLPVETGTYLYAGSLKTVGYTTGTVTVTKGSKTVTGVGTAWLANVDAGMLLGAFSGGFLGVVASVDSNTQITLKDAWQGPTTAGTTYSLQAYGVWFSVSAVAAVGGRLLYAEGRRVKMTKTRDPSTGQPRLWESDPDDYHEFPADVVALATLRDRVFVFTKAGIYVISNAALELVDAFGNAQHRVERASGDVVARSAGGVTAWRDSLVLAAVDGVYVLDATGSMELVSRAVTPLWQAHSKAGDSVGQAMTYRDHLFLPVGGEVLVARLDRRVETGVGKSAPWTRLVQGEGGLVLAMAVQDPNGSAKLIGGASTGGYLLDLSGLFVPALSGSAVDSHGGAYGMVIVTRDFEPADGGAVFVKDVEVDYEAAAGGTIAFYYSDGTRASAGAAPTFSVVAGAAAPVNFSTQAPYRFGLGKQVRRVALQIATGGNVPSWRLRGVRFRFRPRGRRR